METEPQPQPAEPKPSIARRVSSVVFWICFLGWPFLLAIPNPFWGDNVWKAILLAWLLVLLGEAIFPTERASTRRTIGGDILAFLSELLLAFRGPRS